MVPHFLMPSLQTRFAKSLVPGAHLWRFVCGCTVSGREITVKLGRTSLLWCEDTEYIRDNRLSGGSVMTYLKSFLCHDFEQKWKGIKAVGRLFSLSSLWYLMYASISIEHCIFDPVHKQSSACIEQSGIYLTTLTLPPPIPCFRELFRKF